MSLLFKRPGIAAIGIVSVWLVSMLLLMAVTLYRYNMSPDNAYAWMADHFFNTDTRFLHAFELWDGAWYLQTAESGYDYDATTMSNVAFLPLYPFLMRAVSTITGSLTIAAILINVLSMIGAVYFFIKLAIIEKLRESETSDAVFFLLAYPTAIFYLAVYTEALFLCLITGAFYFLKIKKYWIAGLFGMFAAMTRIPGVFLFFPFIYYLFRDGARSKAYLSSLLVLLGTGWYMLILKITTGSGLAFLTAQKHWGRSFFSLQGEHLILTTPAAVINFSFDLLFALLLISGIGLIAKKLDIGYAVFCAIALFIPLSTGTLMSVMRFGMVLFPLFLALAKVERPLVKRAWMTASVVLVTLYTLQFVHGYWAG